MSFIFSKSDNNKSEFSKRLMVIKHRCPQNHPCPSIKVCPVGALSQKGFGAPIVDESKCIKCGKCSMFCPMGALVLE